MVVVTIVDCTRRFGMGVVLLVVLVALLQFPLVLFQNCWAVVVLVLALELLQFPGVVVVV